MDQEFYSIMGFAYNELKPNRVYDKKTPEDFVIPSIYFPRPFIFESTGTLSSYVKTYTVYVKLFYPTPEEATDKANYLMDCILADKRKIPLLNEDGSFADTYIRITKLEITEIESGTSNVGASQLAITWESRYTYGRTKHDYSKMGKIILAGVIE